MTKSPLSPTAAPGAAGLRAPHRVHATLVKPKPKAATASRDAPPSASSTDSPLFQSTTSASPIEGLIKLEASTMTPNAVCSLLGNVDEGLTSSIYYPEFPAQIKTAISTSREALQAALSNLATAEAYARTLRAALEIETNHGRQVLRTAAAACESIDRTDEALVSVGWSLRRIAGRPRPVLAPSQINVKNTAYEGGAEARWTRIGNAQFYEVKAFTSTAGDNPENIPWESLPVIPVRPVSLLFRNQPAGSYLTVRVRAVGSKGPSPWTETATVRVY